MKLNRVIDLSEHRLLLYSDIHYNHENILKLNPDSRNWSNVKEMNSWLRENVWGSLKPGDVVFDLGDTFWRTETDEIDNIFSSIPSGVDLYKTMGNHDSYGLYYGQAPLSKYYKLMSDLFDITVKYGEKNYMLTLCHYPMVSWNHKPYGSLMLHGHCHGNVDDFNSSTPDLRVDIGMDGEFCKSLGTPLAPFEAILDYFTKKTGGISFDRYVKQKQYNL